LHNVPCWYICSKDEQFQNCLVTRGEHFMTKKYSIEISGPQLASLLASLRLQQHIYREVKDYYRFMAKPDKIKSSFDETIKILETAKEIDNVTS